MTVQGNGVSLDLGDFIAWLEATDQEQFWSGAQAVIGCPVYCWLTAQGLKRAKIYHGEILHEDRGYVTHIDLPPTHWLRDWVGVIVRAQRHVMTKAEAMSAAQRILEARSAGHTTE